MAWKKILSSGDIGVEIPGFGHSHEIGLQPEDFNGSPLALTYDGTEYSRATVITETALLQTDEQNLNGGEILTLTDGQTWSKATAGAVGTGSSKLLGVFVGSDGAYVRTVLDGFVALPPETIAPTNEGTVQAGDLMYLSNTLGTITSVPVLTAGKVVRTVGYCLSYTQGTGGIFWFKPENLWLEIATP